MSLKPFPDILRNNHLHQLNRFEPAKTFGIPLAEVTSDNVLIWNGYYGTESTDSKGKILMLDPKPLNLLKNGTSSLATNIYRGMLTIFDFEYTNVESSLKLTGGFELGQPKGNIGGETTITVRSVNHLLREIRIKNDEIQTKLAMSLMNETSKLIGESKPRKLGDVPTSHYPSFAVAFAALARYHAAHFAYAMLKKVFPNRNPYQDTGNNDITRLKMQESDVYLSVINQRPYTRH